MKLWLDTTDGNPKHPVLGVLRLGFEVALIVAVIVLAIFR